MRNDTSPRACAHFLDDFSDFVDHALPPDRNSEILAHLDCCEACLRHLSAYRRGVAALQAREVESDPEAFWTRLERRLWHGGHLATDRSGGGWAGHPAAAIAAAAMFALVVFFAGIWGNAVWPGGAPSGDARGIVVVEGPEAPAEPGGMAMASVGDFDGRASASRATAVGDAAHAADAPRPRRPAPREPVPTSAVSTPSTTPALAPAGGIVAAARVATRRAAEERTRELERAIENLERRLGREEWRPPALTREGWIRPVTLERVPIHAASTPLESGPWTVEAAIGLP